MAFDPDKFLLETKPVEQKRSFDPEKFLAETKAPSSSDQYGFGEHIGPTPFTESVRQGTVNLMAKPFQAAIAPFSQAATATSNLIQGNPQEPIINPITEPSKYLSKYGTTKPFFETLPVGNEPIYKGVSPNEAASLIADIGISHKAIVPAAESVSGATQDILRSGAEKKRIQSLARISGMPEDVSAETLARGQYGDTVDTLKRYGLANKISNPTALSEDLNGGKLSTIDRFGNRAQINNPLKPGLINTVGKDVQDAVNQLNMSARTIRTQDMIDSIVNDVALKSGGPGSLAQFGPSEEASLRNRLGAMFDPNSYPTRSMSQLIDMKRDAADMIYKIKNNPEQYAVQGITSIEPYKGVWGFVDDYVNTLADRNVPGALELVGKNNDLSNLYRARDMVSHVPLESVTAPSLPEAILAQRTGKLTGHPMMGARPAGALIKKQLSTLPARFANVAESGADILQNTQQGPLQVSSAAAAQEQQPQQSPVQVNPQGRFPQSVSISHPNLKGNLPMQLVSYQIPRNSDQILQNKDVVSAKIAQMSGDPNITDMVNDTLNNHPEKLKDMLPGLVLKFPNLFENDKYNRIDGHIIDPAMRQKALKDISNDHTMSIREKALKSKRLAEEGILE